MVRFIRVEKGKIDDETEYFAWWDTIHDVFMTFEGEQMFESWEQFEEYYVDSKYAGSREFPLSRFKGLFKQDGREGKV